MEEDRDEYAVESTYERLSRKTKESPFMIAGIIGMVGALGVGAYKFKRRGNMSASLYLMQLRVIAQGAVVGSLTLGLAYSIGDQFWKKYKKTHS